MNLQNTIKKRRKTLSLSQNDLSEMSGLSLATIKSIERGKGNPSITTVSRIMDVLGMEIIYRVRNTIIEE
ncbi:MAG: helix-turn-helix transcriptional regulator [Bacteroidales bacterium]|nr:helix-turn-helix transcriptional regulator [Bacteroidales bacterium]